MNQNLRRRADSILCWTCEDEWICQSVEHRHLARHLHAQPIEVPLEEVDQHQGHDLEYVLR